MSSAQTIYYARCPVPTASGIAFQRGMFDKAFAESESRVRNIRELGPDRANVHFTHEHDSFIREGGCTPAIWARSAGARTRLLGITFMREPLGIYVRADDAIDTVADLCDRRVALPVWPRLVFNFWRVSAHLGFLSALDAHRMSTGDVRFTDVLEDKDPHRRLNLPKEQTTKLDDTSEYSGQLEALLNGNVDAIFAKGPESAIVVRQARGAIRLLYNICQSTNVDHHINNSTPRLITCSEQLLMENPAAVELYIATIIEAATWARKNSDQLRSFVARECGIEPSKVDEIFPAEYECEFLPALNPELIGRTEKMKRFMLEHQYIDRDYSIDEWVCSDPLEVAA